MDVLFAPDWREGNSYQELLADALTNRGHRVSFLGGYKRVLPLSRLLGGRNFDILHLHWPEAYAPLKHDGWDWIRRARFPADLAYATKGRVLVVTAHNLYWHNRWNEAFIRTNVSTVFRHAKVTFAHSQLARDILIREFGLIPERVPLIPHGDLSYGFGPPLNADNARQMLLLDRRKIALMFGAVEPYKGPEAVIAWWRTNCPDAVLAIVGRPMNDEYGEHISSLASGASNIIVRLGWLSDRTLHQWLSVADVAIFNYRQIFTSGAACLARSYGVPLLIPASAATVSLGEPSGYVRRFASVAEDFGAQLATALEIKPDYAAAGVWRATCSWDAVARLTENAYRQALNIV